MKKAKLLVAIAAVSVVGIAAAAVATANLTGGLNTVHVRADKLPERQEGGLVSGNAIYLKIKWGSANWDAGGSAQRAVYFYNDSGHAWSNLVSYVETIGDNEYMYFEAKVPGDNVTWKAAIAVKFKYGATDYESFDEKEEQSGDIFLTDTNNVLDNSIDWGSTWTDQSYYSWQDRILAWADEDWVADADEWDSDTVCTLTDEYTYEQRLQVITTSWEASKARYEAIAGADVKAAFSNFDWLVDEAPEQLKKLAERYDYLVRTYNLEDFAQRGI